MYNKQVRRARGAEASRKRETHRSIEQMNLPPIKGNFIMNNFLLLRNGIALRAIIHTNGKPACDFEPCSRPILENFECNGAPTVHNPIVISDVLPGNERENVALLK